MSNPSYNQPEYKILFVEDEENLVDIYHDSFEQKNIFVYSTSSIDEALVIAKKEKIDLVLLDLILPVKDGRLISLGQEEGFRFLEIAKKDKIISQIPVIIFSNLENRVSRQRAKEYGAKDYIIKANYLPKEAVEMIIKHLPKK